MKPKIVIVAGPTASGKTAISLSLAKRLNGEIVNIDSVQIYKHFNIGSAKINITEREGVPHHLIDFLEPDQDFNVAQYKILADSVASEIIGRGRTPIFVGGSTLYIKVLLHGISSEMPSNLELRNQLELEDLNHLVEELVKLDPKLSKSIDLENKRRVVRAVESLRLGDVAVSQARATHNFEDHDYQALIILPEVERTLLYQNINQRVTTMIDSGLISETEQIVQRFGLNCPALRSIGYREVIQYLNNQIGLKDLPELIAMNTRRFAKRQLTFWRNEPEKRSWKRESSLSQDLFNLEISSIFSDLTSCAVPVTLLPIE